MNFTLESIIAIILAMTFHEFGHAYISYKLGDPTPQKDGRLTLNPFKHIDFFGMLMIIVVGFGWAKPVQINSQYYKDKKLDTMLVSAAGPIMNLIIAVIVTLFLNFNILTDLLNKIVFVNIVLGVFNLLPIPPLDGSKIVTGFLPEKLYFKWLNIESFGFIILLILMITGVMNAPLMNVVNIIKEKLFNYLLF